MSPYEKMAARRYPICMVYSPADEGYIAWLPDFGCNACSAWGETPEEALQALRVAAEGIIEYFEEERGGAPVPTHWTDTDGPPPLLDEAYKK